VDRDGIERDNGIHGPGKLLDTKGLIRPPNESHIDDSALDLTPSGVDRVKSFAFYRVARVST
jgi:hypothetical protein